jgi:hypothetical protein
MTIWHLNFLDSLLISRLPTMGSIKEITGRYLDLYYVEEVLRRTHHLVNRILDDRGTLIAHNPHLCGVN